MYIRGPAKDSRDAHIEDDLAMEDATSRLSEKVVRSPPGAMGVARAKSSPVDPPAGALTADQAQRVARRRERRLGLVEARELVVQLPGQAEPDAKHGADRVVACVAALQLVGELADLVDVLIPLDQRVGEVGDELPPLLVIRGERERTPKQVLCSGEVTALERCAPRPAESRGRTSRERRCGRVVRVELAPVTGRLLEVVTDDLVLFDERGVCVEPIREALV